MITQKELKKHYKIFKHKNSFLIHNLEPGNSRMVYKYLCSIINKRGTWTVPNHKPTGKIEVLKNNIKSYIESLEYDSEYYYPLYREGLFEELIINDYLSDLNFVISGNYRNTTTFIYNKKNIYGKEKDLSLTFSGLDCFNEIPEYIDISYYIDFGSWISVKVKRNVEDIKKGIDSILRPLNLTDAATSLIENEKLESEEQLDILFNKLVNFSKDTVSTKEYLKSKLIELSNKI